MKLRNCLDKVRKLRLALVGTLLCGTGVVTCRIFITELDMNFFSQGNRQDIEKKTTALVVSRKF